ncbi:MAG: phosphate ABC transporter substrate-binding protein, PhoT family [Bacteroidales bacterium]|jgi:phosphate transport system substrate-binding protein|nr:phosphate ABC transporter substrate-binding protein, PhoT family [Bacteroidales bacterium]
MLKLIRIYINTVCTFVCKHLRRAPAAIIFVSAVILCSCGSGAGTATDETPTRGNIKITVDESFQPLLDTEVSTFMQLYTNATIKARYKPEYDVINDFMHDSVKVIVTSKKLTDDQIKYLRDSLIVARTITFAYDGIALVTNRQNRDTLLRYEQVRDIFSGKAVSWSDLDPRSELGDIRIIFDNTKSGNIRYFKELFEITEALPSNFYAVNSNPEVIEFVSRNPDALGIISVNWISNKYDFRSRSYAEQVNILAISRPMIDDGSYYRPDQGWIYDRSYPFVREVYMITRETFKGLGAGFIQWSTAEQGQRIVLKSGLVPATMPIRLVQIRNE